MNELDILCKCGHSKSSHFNAGMRSGCSKRRGWGIGGTGWVDDCKEYQPDNLLHIEQLAKQKGLV